MAVHSTKDAIIDLRETGQLLGRHIRTARHNFKIEQASKARSGR